jgi:beta-galactosidase
MSAMQQLILCRYEDANILKEELCVNAVRTSHYPQSHAFLDACDRLGLLSLQRFPAGSISVMKHGRSRLLRIQRNGPQYRNHVSIFLWGVRINESLDDDPFYQKTNEAAHALDPTRPTSGVRYLEKSSLLEDVYAYNDFSHTGNNPGCKLKRRMSLKDTSIRC